jgi:surfactin synthase thioesterase subunit
MTTTPTATTPTTEPALRCLHPSAAATTLLFGFPHAGGGPNSFRSLSAELAPSVEVWEVILPGRGARSAEPFATSWPELVADVSSSIERHADDRWVAFFGHSFGGLVGYEVAAELERRGTAAPSHLFVSGCRAPHRAHMNRWTLPAEDADLISEVEERYGAIPRAVRDEPELLARFLPILRADLYMYQSYQPAPGRLQIPITALAGTADRAGPPHEVPYWGEHTEAEFRTATMIGAHFFVYTQGQAVGRIVRSALSIG